MLTLKILTLLFIILSLRIGHTFVSAEWPLDIAVIMGMTGTEEYKRYIDGAIDRFREVFPRRSIQSHHPLMRLAYIEYMDHQDENDTFVTKLHDFTESTKELRSWIDNAQVMITDRKNAPNALSDALEEVKKLTWRKESTKIAILITGNPPHGLDPDSDLSLPNGCPKGYDPVETVRFMAHCGISLYTIGIGKSVKPYKDFFSALAYITGGQYLQTDHPRRLYDIIHLIGYEWCFITDIGKLADSEIKERIAAEKPMDHQNITNSVYQSLKKMKILVFQIARNKKVMKEPSKLVKTLSDLPSFDKIRVKMRRRIRRLQRKMQLQEQCSQTNETYACDHKWNNQNETQLSDEIPETNNKLKVVGNRYSLDDGYITRAQAGRLVKRQITIFAMNCKYGRVDLSDETG